jgi:hypothetical protein
MHERGNRLGVIAVLALGFLLACSRGGPASTKAGSERGSTGAETQSEDQLTRHALLLAGLDDPRDRGDPLRATAAFRDHAREMAALWQRYDTSESERIRPWVIRNLAPLQHAQTLFYPFAGADFLFAHAFFPQVRTYVLVGLERVGALGNLDRMAPGNLEQEYARVRKTVAPLLRSTFFKTLEMQEDVLQDGVMTILATLIAGTHHKIVDVREISLSADGHVIDRSIDRALTPGAQIDFEDEQGGELHTLYYFREDLSDKGLSKQGALLAFVDALPSKVAFAKAAAYCMHGQPFSIVRNDILNDCDGVLEDDTGIPLRYFRASEWDLRYFGHYSQPIDMFMNYRQEDLARAFAEGKNVFPLTFHVGYGGGPGASNLLLALKRGKLAE